MDMELGSLDEGENDEHNGISFLDTSVISQYRIRFFGGETFGKASFGNIHLC